MNDPLRLNWIIFLFLLIIWIFNWLLIHLIDLIVGKYQDMVFKSFCDAKEVNTCWRFCAHIKETKSSNFGKFYQSKRLNKIWLKSNIENMNSMDSWTKFYPNSILLHILKWTLMPGTCKLLSEAISKFQKFKENLKTEFHLPAWFKALDYFQYIAGGVRNLLQSSSRAKAQEIATNRFTV